MHTDKIPSPLTQTHPVSFFFLNETKFRSGPEFSRIFSRGFADALNLAIAISESLQKVNMLLLTCRFLLRLILTHCESLCVSCSVKVIPCGSFNSLLIFS